GRSRTLVGQGFAVIVFADVDYLPQAQANPQVGMIPQELDFFDVELELSPKEGRLEERLD
ncbi:hypothetical protein Tco_1036611, partial [Tanacetum coccineum]